MIAPSPSTSTTVTSSTESSTIQLPDPPRIIANLPPTTNQQMVEVWESQRAVLERGQYTLSNGATIQLREGMQNAIDGSERFDDFRSLTSPQDPSFRGPLTPSLNGPLPSFICSLVDRRPHPYETELIAVKGDCLEEAIRLRNAGYNPIVLNMANPQHVGGNYRRGARSQEEDLFRRTTLAFALDPLWNRQSRQFYPFPNYCSAIYTPNVSIIRSGAMENYQLLDRPAVIGVVTSAALYAPSLTTAYFALENPPFRASVFANADDRRKTIEAIRMQLLIAVARGHDAIVLSAFGCGAFRNPPAQIVQIYLEELQSIYRGFFRIVDFAIIEDINSRQTHNPEGNFEPFARAVERSGGRVYR